MPSSVMPGSPTKRKGQLWSASSRKDPSRKLTDYLKPSSLHAGSLLGFLATSYEFDSDFFETDFLPNVLSLGAWDDRNWASRIAMERALAEISTACVIMDSACYRTRPRSLRVEFVPATRLGGTAIHGKVLVLHYEREVRLLVGSANLTQAGYRCNIEVASALTATPSALGEAAPIIQAIAAVQQHYAPWLTPAASALLRAAQKQVEDWSSPAEQQQPLASSLFGGGSVPLITQFVDLWPASEPIRRIEIVSPFWSESQVPLTYFLNTLRKRNLLAEGAELKLITEARILPDGSALPVLPVELQTFDPSPWGVSIKVQAANPSVAKEDVEGRENLAATRVLHAKIVALCGSHSVLVYTGSANFTARGWSLGMSGNQTNVEAGLAVQYSCAEGTKWLRDCLPRGLGPIIELPCAGVCRIEIPECGPEPEPWPVFLHRLTLSPHPSRHGDLILEAALNSAVTPPIVWRIRCVEVDESRKAIETLYHASFIEQSACELLVEIELLPSVLNHLLLTQELLVEWEVSDPVASYSRRIPLNVEAGARLSLPTAPGSRNPGERALLDYYQGRIAFEDVFPVPDQETSICLSPEDKEIVVASGVDTSRIQSYIVREFVEALRGIEDELKRATASEPKMLFALRGPVSPLALGKLVVNAAKGGRRTPVAGAFQLVELIQCVRACRDRCDSNSLADIWRRHVDDAAQVLERHLLELKADHPQDFAGNTWYCKYEEVALFRGGSEDSIKAAAP